MDPTFEIPDPMRNHKAGLVTEVDPEWEQEVAPYDPTAVAMSKPVIRLFQNMPKAYVFLKLHPQQTVCAARFKIKC